MKVEGLEPLGPLDMIVVLAMDKITGLYDVIMVTNGSRWREDSKQLLDNYLFHVTITKLGQHANTINYGSIEEFEENEINI